MNRRELELLAEKCTSLTFELVGSYQESETREHVQSSGSGIFVAPCHALTAKHVVNDLHNVNAAWADEVRRREGDGYRWLPYHSFAFQIVDVNQPNRTAAWGMTRAWPTALTDIASLELAPGDDDARVMLERMRTLFPVWSLLPPAVGSAVGVVGQVRDKAPSPGVMAHAATYYCLPATVMKIFETRHDRGMYSFPGFLLDIEVPHGMSGGPVFHNGNLCGIISGGLGDGTYVSSLWPLCLTMYESPNLGELNRQIGYVEVLEMGQIKAIDWKLVKGNLSYYMEDGRPVARLGPPGATGPDSNQES